MNTHFLAKLGSFFRENMKQLVEMSEDDLASAVKQARAYAGGKQKSENRTMTMSESFGKDGDWRLFMEREFAEPPITIQVLPKAGSYSHPKYGKFTMTPEIIQSFVDNHNNRVYQDQVPIDAEHQSKLSGAIGYYGEMMVIDEGRGGAEANVTWTDRGKELIASDAFQYFSPEWFDSWNDPASGKQHNNVLVGGAITTRPFFKDKAMRPLVASEDHYQAGEWGIDDTGDAPVKTLTFSEMQFAEVDLKKEDPEEPDDTDDPNDTDDGTPDAKKNSKKANLDAGDVHVNGLVKTARDFTKKERDKDAGSGAALPDGSFPIVSKTDLGNAVQAYGRASDKAKAKAHIISRAKDLGATGMLPDSWVGRKAAVEDIDEKTKEFVETQTKQLSEQLDEEKGLRKAAEDRLVKLEDEGRVRRFNDVIMGRDPSGDGSPPFAGKHETHHRTMTVLAKEFGEASEEFGEYVSEQRVVSKQVRDAGLFTEKGMGSGPSQLVKTGDAEKRFNEARDEWLKENPGKSKSDAIVAVSATSPRAYTDYIKERNEAAKKSGTDYGYGEDE